MRLKIYCTPYTGPCASVIAHPSSVAMPWSAGAHIWVYPTVCSSLMSGACGTPLRLLRLKPSGCLPAVSIMRSCGDAVALGACWNSCARAMSCKRPNSCFLTLSKASSRRCSSSVAFCIHHDPVRQCS